MYKKMKGYKILASIQARRDKQGHIISYSIRVHRGRDASGKQLKPYTTTFHVQPNWTEKSAEKKAAAFAATFEKQCREGTISDTRVKFVEYCNYVIDLREQRGLKHSTAVRYKELTARIYPAIGHIKLRELRPDQLNTLYTDLCKDGVKKGGGKLSTKTVLEHHRLIHTVLEQALKEGLIPFNPADRVTLPKLTKKEVNYFQPAQISAICDALEDEPIKWKTLTHMYLISGARRGEILGLKWENVDFDNSRIHICNNVLYTPDRGIYEDTPKTDSSKRYVALPGITMNLLKEYKAWQLSEIERLGEFYVQQGFVFSQENGNPMHPDSVTDWLNKFSIRRGLPHINPHAFRHTMASMLYYNNYDSVRISSRLGHAQVSTTENIYAHSIDGGDKEIADALADSFLKKKTE